MRILITGASSFTGAWFADELAKAGHDVFATFRRGPSEYSEVRAARVSMLNGKVTPIWGTDFGDGVFQDAVKSGRFDLLCHHAAEMTDYRSWDFDALLATARNTHNIRDVLTAFAEGGGTRLIITGSVFEPYEGLGDPTRRAFNPYGLSKHLSFEVCRLEAVRLGLQVDKFVIPNPFGPLEEPRFTSYLTREWLAGQTPSVRTPAYIRDNIHVSLLARAYLAFCSQRGSSNETLKAAPSGYVESQGDFASRVGREMAERLGVPTLIETLEQTVFDEPLVRINHPVREAWAEGWDEDAAWDSAAEFWRTAA